MITFYTYPGPNGRKVSVMLEEAHIPYEIQKVDIEKGEQFRPEFLKINPNNKIPAIFDKDTANGGAAVFEVGAILIYLAEKSGKFLPAAPETQSRNHFLACVGVDRIRRDASSASFLWRPCRHHSK